MKRRSRMHALMCCFIIFFTVLGSTISHAAGQSQVLEFVNNETQTTRIVNVHTESFAEKTGDLKNPDRGFYHIHQFIIEDTPKGLDYYKADIGWFLSEQGNPNDKGHTLTLVEIDLKNYRDRDITPTALTVIDGLDHFPVPWYTEIMNTTFSRRSPHLPCSCVGAVFVFFQKIPAKNACKIRRSVL